MKTSHVVVRTLFGAALAVPLLFPGAARAASSEDPDWPCVQRKVPEISAGMIWAGPPVEEQQSDWRDDYVVAQLAGTLAARRVDIEDAKSRIAAFAAEQEADRNDKLTLLFTGILHRINIERGQIIAGIKRYAKRQTALAERIEALTVEYNALPAAESESERSKLEELEQQLVWDTRVYDERERSLIYVCEQPVLLEQRAFALSREIMNHLDR